MPSNNTNPTFMDLNKYLHQNIQIFRPNEYIFTFRSNLISQINLIPILAQWIFRKYSIFAFMMKNDLHPALSFESLKSRKDSLWICFVNKWVKQTMAELAELHTVYQFLPS